MLVLPSLADIPNPFGWFVPALFVNPHEPDSKSTGGEHWDTELAGDRWPDPLFVLVTKQINVTPHY